MMVGEMLLCTEGKVQCCEDTIYGFLFMRTYQPQASG